MELRDHLLMFSASDLNEFLECRHLTRLEYERAIGGQKPPPRDEFVAFISEKGMRHEERFLKTLLAAGSVTGIPSMLEASLDECISQTQAAMAAGAPTIYQACFRDEKWRGQADFLFRVSRPSKLGDYSYEVGDTKLALHAKPYHVLQLCFYSEMVAKAQGIEPEMIRVILGAQNVVSLRLADYMAYYRRVKERFLAQVGTTAETYPEPCAHCAVCRWSPICETKREADDHLSRVANIRKSQIVRLAENEIRSLTALAAANSGDKPTRMESVTFEKLRQQATLQLSFTKTGVHEVKLLPLEAKAVRGFSMLPPADAGDVFFDMEGDPLYWEGDPRRVTGLEYLFGSVTVNTGEPQYDKFFARNRTEEKRAFEGFVDMVFRRLVEYPNLHVYHYAHYEKSTLERMAEFHGTREDKVAELLRAGVLVDLYAVVRQALQISQPSYSIKKLEAFYRPAARDGDVQGGAASVLAFEKWLDDGAVGEPKEIIEYNKDDCVSTYELLKWLRAKAEEAGVTEASAVAVLDPKEIERSEKSKQRREEIAKVVEALRDGYPDDDSKATPVQRHRKLLSDLLLYHDRDDRPAYWKYYYRRDKASYEELFDDAEAIVGLKLDEGAPPYEESKSLVYTLTFPVQETKISKKSQLIDPATDDSSGTIVDIDPKRGIIKLKRGEKLQQRPFPKIVITGKPMSKNDLTDVLVVFAREVLAKGLDGTEHTALRDILTRTPSRLAGKLVPDEPIVTSLASEAIDTAVGELDESYLFIQGPPGSGKTYTGAHAIVSMLAKGKRVGIAANAHKAIHNLLDEVEAIAKRRGVVFSGYKKCTGDDRETIYDSPSKSIESVSKSKLPEPGQLIACTVHSFPKVATKRELDVVFIDEAGQVALADALAVGMSAKNVVFLGDPLQLAQVSQATHPGSAGDSVLEYLLGDELKIPANRGIFLNETRRMHPGVCQFISTVVYGGGLDSIPACSERSISVEGRTLTGLRQVPVEHSGCSQRSDPEAAQAVRIVRNLRNGLFRDGSITRPMREDDILVVAPYNAQVQNIRAALDDAGLFGVRAGTVDKFQGQEAAAVIYSMTTSSREDLPRDIDFLFSRNRLNVAISRAQCLAVLLYAPQLLDIGCNDTEQMRLVNALCVFAEQASILEEFALSERAG
jgi:uncharacterized protein